MYEATSSMNSALGTSWSMLEGGAPSSPPQDDAASAMSALALPAPPPPETVVRGRAEGAGHTINERMRVLAGVIARSE